MINHVDVSEINIEYDILHKKLQNSNFVGKNIFSWLKNNINYRHTINSDRFVIYYYSKYNLLKQNDKIKLRKIIKTTNAIYNILNNDKILVIHIFNCPIKKYIPKISSTNIIGPEHINSGMTVNANTIYIWRNHEYNKVLIHELLHAFEIEHCFWNKRNEISNIFNEIFHEIESDFYIAEAICETYACILSKKMDSKKTTKQIIKNEIQNSAKNCAIIKKYYDHNISNYTEKTNVFAYFYLKLALLLSPEFENLFNTVFVKKHNNCKFEQFIINEIILSIRNGSWESHIDKYYKKIKPWYHNKTIMMCSK